MLITLVATLCMQAHPATCAEERFNVTMSQCQVTAQQGLADFMSHHPLYGRGWRVAGWKCYVGNPPPKKVDL